MKTLQERLNTMRCFKENFAIRKHLDNYNIFFAAIDLGYDFHTSVICKYDYWLDSFIQLSYNIKNDGILEVVPTWSGEEIVERRLGYHKYRINPIDFIKADSIKTNVVEFIDDKLIEKQDLINRILSQHGVIK